MLGFLARICASVCHAMPERTFSFGGQPLPLCARCTGVYMGFAIAMIWFASTRLRGVRLVPGPILGGNVAVVALFALFGFAGLYGLISMPNEARLLLGLFFGAALGTFAFPLTREWLLNREAREWGRGETLRLLALWAVLLGIPVIVRQGFAFLFLPVAGLAVIGLVGSHLLADLLILNWALRPKGRWTAARAISLLALAGLLCVGEFAFYSAWRRWWEVS